jgi:hypothetical protein
MTNLTIHQRNYRTDCGGSTKNFLPGASSLPAQAGGAIHTHKEGHKQAQIQRKSDCRARIAEGTACSHQLVMQQIAGRSFRFLPIFGYKYIIVQLENYMSCAGNSPPQFTVKGNDYTCVERIRSYLVCRIGVIRFAL